MATRRNSKRRRDLDALSALFAIRDAFVGHTVPATDDERAFATVHGLSNGDPALADEIARARYGRTFADLRLAAGDFAGAYEETITRFKAALAAYDNKFRE